jgi:bifunctional non-homologous end joining protein LigD
MSSERKPLPQFVAPMMALVVKEAFDHPDWIFETKLDGFRAIAVIDSAGKARLWSRNRLPLEPKFPMVLAAVDRLKLRSTVPVRPAAHREPPYLFTKS